MTEENMQQLESRNTYAPMDAVLVHSNCDLSLKVLRSRGGVTSLKTFSNNSEEHHSHNSGSSDLRVQNNIVYVLNMRGKSLMPTTQQKANKILKQGRAKVVHREPFIIQLKYATGENKQDIVLGIDAGYRTIGYSAITAGEELIAGELELRTDIKRLLEKRRAYRRSRRGRKGYRKQRFDNRARPKGWLNPSLEHKLQSHIKLIERLKKLLPITKVVVEVASFDQQRMQNPEINGIEYQQGELQGYAIREYLLEKWKRKCAYCGKMNIPLEIEHIVPKSRGGTDRVSNLTISCHECNQKKGNKTAKEFGYSEIQNKAKKSLKATVFMNIIRWKLVNLLNCNYTYGYVTKYNRIKLGLEKSHRNDAFAIAGGDEQERSEVVYISKQVRRQNRSLYKANLLKNGRKKRNTIKEVKGYRRFDKVLYKKRECFIFGLRSSGYFDLRDIKGNKIGASVNSKNLMFLECARGVIQEVKRAIPPHVEGILAYA